MGYLLTMLNSYQRGAWWWKSVSIQLEKQFHLWRWPLKEWSYPIVLCGEHSSIVWSGHCSALTSFINPERNFAPLHFYLVGFRTFTFSSSPSPSLGAVLSQGMAISHCASVTLGYNLCCAKLCSQPVVGGDGTTMGSLILRGRWLHGWIYSWALRQCQSMLLLLPGWLLTQYPSDFFHPGWVGFWWALCFLVFI